LAYALYSDVTRRIPGRPLTGTSSPSTSDLTQWIAEAEAMLEGSLVAGGVSIPITAASGIQIIKSWACDYAEGRARMALAAGAGDGANDDGKDLIDRFEKRLEDISKNPAGAEAMLTGGGTSDTARRVRCYQLDNKDGVVVGDGGVADRIFDRDENF
jgi:hypothetical protein